MPKRIELKGERRLTSERAAFARPAFSSDGRLVVEASERGGVALYALDAKGRVEQRLGPGSEAAFAPEGARLAFVRPGSDGRREVWLCDLATPDQAHRLAGGDGAVWEHPTWSPDGREVACVSDWGSPGGLRHVWLLDAASGERRRVTWDPQRSDGHPAFAADGRALAFDGDDRADDAREIDCYVLDLPTGELHRLTDGAVTTRRPTFIDRRWLVAERRSVMGPTLVVLDRAKRRTLPVGEAPGGERAPTVRPLHDRAHNKQHERIVIAYVRRDAQTGRDAVWSAELRGLKVVSESDARAAEAEDAAALAGARIALPTLPPPPPGAVVEPAEETSGNVARGIDLDLYDADESEAR